MPQMRVPVEIGGRLKHVRVGAVLNVEAEQYSVRW
jgi:hypothetical protein